jgi:outer membrane protein TolC
MTRWIPPARAQKKDPLWAAARAQTNDFSRPLALADLTDVALKNNPATARAWHDARAAYEQVKQARGYFMPTVTAVGSASTRHISASPSSFDLERNQYGPGLQLSYLVINFGGGQRAAVEQALQTVYAADYTFNQTLQSVLFAVESAYYGVVSAQAAVEASDAGVRDARLVLEAAQEGLKQGLGTRLAVLQAQAACDQALYAGAAARGQLRTVQGALAQAVGVPADIAIRIEPPTNRVPEVVAIDDMRRFIDEALDRRSDIGALRANLAAREAAVTVAGASLWPSLYLNGSLSQTAYDTQTGSQPMQDSDVAYDAGISLRWTLFDGWQTWSAKHAAEEQAESARAALRQAEVAASADVWARYQAYVSALEKHRFSEAFLASASASYDLALQSYRAQLTSLLDLLQAEAQLAQARTQWVAARQEVFLTLTGLAYATGRLEKSGAGERVPVLSTPIDEEMKP